MQVNNLKSLREAADLSLQTLADMCGRSKGQIWELEKDNANPTLSTAYAVAKVLGKSVYDIWTDATEIVEEQIIVRRVVAKPKAEPVKDESKCLWCKGAGVIKTSPNPRVIGMASCTYCGGTGKAHDGKLEELLKTMKPLKAEGDASE